MPDAPSRRAAPPEALGADWLGACRNVVEGMRAMFAAHPTTAERAVETGRGEGGDQALVIDRAAEDLVFAELERIAGEGHAFQVVSEERGTVDFGDDGVRVVVDPIDGSLNAKRGMPHHALSLAVADGPAMGDVAFGFVFDFGPGEEWVARRGEGAWMDGRRLDPEAPERRNAAGRLEVVGIESADPRWVAARANELVDRAHRLRAVGAIALSLCQVAAARMDGMASLKPARSVDAAAGQLIVREAGGLVAFPGVQPWSTAGLDLVARYPVVAARSPEGLAELEPLSDVGPR